MGKSLIPYILLLCFSCIYINGIAANIQTIQKAVGKQCNVKLTQSSADLSLPDSAKESFARNAESFALSVITAHFITDNMLVICCPGLSAGKIIGSPVTKRNQKNHLLHLFPSHYFW